MLVRAVWLQVVTDLANAADRSESKLPDRKSELCVLRDTLNAKTEQEEKDEKKMLDRDADDIGEGSARGTVSATAVYIHQLDVLSEQGFCTSCSVQRFWHRICSSCSVQCNRHLVFQFKPVGFRFFRFKLLCITSYVQSIY